MPQCKTIGIQMGRKRETNGRTNESRNARINTIGTMRLLYSPSLILAADILCVSKLREGLLT
jgi:hypothetical protein